MAQNHDQSIL